MYVPKNYYELSAYDNNMLPSTIHYVNNATYSYWERSLFQRASSVLIKKGNNDWNGKTKDFLYYCLFRFGFVMCWDADKFGKVFSPCTLHGRNFYYQPTNAITTNPALDESVDLIIGEQCELLSLTPDYLGIWDIIQYYAIKLSLLDISIDMSIINSKFAWLIGAKNKGVAMTLKKIFDKINRGETAVIFDEALKNDGATKDAPWQFLERTNIKNSYITNDLLQDMMTIIYDFDAEIGISTVPYAKKERMVQSEAESRENDATSRSKLWLECLNDSCDKINALFNDPDFIHFSLRFENEDVPEEGDKNE